MSYAKHGISFSGLGEAMTVNLRTGDERVRALQIELARLGFLESGAAATGADGKWGPRTETALRNAARYVNYTSAPFNRSGSTTVTVPDELLGLIRAASPAPAGTEGRVASAASPGASAIVGTTQSSATTAGGAPGSRAAETPPPVEDSWTDRQILGVRAPVFIAGSVGLLLAVGAGVYFMSTSGSEQKAVAQNRRRRRR